MKKIIKRIAGVAIAVLCLGSVCSDFTNVNLFQVEALAEVPQAPTKTLKKGAKGEQVQRLQKCLNYIMDAGLSIDGSFGPATDTAVRNFQKKFGLEVDGSVGPATRAKINDILNIETPEPTPAPAPAPAASTLSISGAQYPSGTLTKGKSFGIRGIISSNYTILNVTAQIKSDTTLVQSKTVYPNSGSYDLKGEINNSMLFGKLPSGNYTFTVAANDTNSYKQLIYTSFSVSGNTYSSSATADSSTSKISTAQINSVLNQYNLYPGNYWLYNNSSDAKAYTGRPRSEIDFKSSEYVYNGAKQCKGFADFVMSKVTGSTVNAGRSSTGWKLYSPSSISSLQVGDIVRTSGHSAIVLSVSNGKCTFVECWGSQKPEKNRPRNYITKGGFNGNSKLNTLNNIKNTYKVEYIYRYVG